jgi:hypothetical protein
VSERGYCTNWGKSAKHWEGSAHLPAVLDRTVIQPGCPSRVGAGPGQKDAKATLFPGVRPSINSYPYPQSPTLKRKRPEFKALRLVPLRSVRSAGMVL